MGQVTKDQGLIRVFLRFFKSVSYFFEFQLRQSLVDELGRMPNKALQLA